MNTRDLEYLVAVADELHFGRAAERCHASQSALSGQIRKLEDQLGVQVFERSKRHVQVTEAGAAVVAQARVILRQVEGLHDLACSRRDPLAGHCTLGMPPTIGPYLTPRILPALKEALPDLRLDLVEDFTDHLEEQLADGDLDLAILATTPTHSTLTEIPLYDEPFWVALPAGHPLAEGETVQLEDIRPSDLLLLSDGHCLRDQIYQACKLDRTSSSDSGPRTKKTSLSTILSLVGAGHGMTLVPAMSLSGAWVTDGGISIRREASGTAGRCVRLTHRKGYHRMALVERLVTVIRSVLPNTVRSTRRG
ncbi:MAG: LysR substrate-binding domain-containing protein [Pseudomonadota bacterium]